MEGKTRVKMFDKGVYFSALLASQCPVEFV
jgi:hypothetical protein